MNRRALCTKYVSIKNKNRIENEREKKLFKFPLFCYLAIKKFGNINGVKTFKIYLLF